MASASANERVVSHDSRLNLLISDYEMAREDDRTLASVTAALFSVAVALIGVLAAGVYQTCAFHEESGCYKVGELVLAAAPLLPLGCCAYLVSMGVVSVVRSYYLRAVEDELRTYANGPLLAIRPVKPASYAALVNEILSLRSGRAGYRAMAALMVLSILGVFGGLTIDIALHVSVATRWLMALYIPAVALVLYEYLSLAVNGRGVFRGVVEGHLRTRNQRKFPNLSSTDPPECKPLLPYLLMPRPGDAFKYLVAPIAYLLVAWPIGALSRWREFLCLWLVFEVLIYAARYQWNDVRGLAGDSAHPEAAHKARLPLRPSWAEQRTVVIASLAVAAVKIAVAIVVGLVAGLALPVLALIGATVVTAVTYEYLRSMEGPDHVVPASVPAVSLWIVVGFGYCIRTWIGLFSTGLHLAGATALLAMATFFALGVTFVLLIWVLEGASFCHETEPGQWRASAELRGKPHLASLLWFTDLKPELTQDPAVPKSSGATERILLDRGHVLSPWNLAGLVAIVTGTGLAVQIPLVGHLSRGQTVVVTAGLAVCFVGLAMVKSKSRAVLWATFAAVAIVLVVLAATVGGPAASALVPWLGVAGSYVCLRATSFRELRTATMEMVVSAVVVAWSLFRKVVGEKTWRWLHFDDTFAAPAVDAVQHSEVHASTRAAANGTPVH
jgi:hypothetical protein